MKKRFVGVYSDKRSMDGDQGKPEHMVNLTTETCCGFPFRVENA